MFSNLKLTRGDVVAFGFLTVAVLAIFLFEMLVVKPYLAENNYRHVWVHLVVAIVIALNLYSSLFRLVRTDTSTLGHVMPSELLEDWHYCFVCEANSPPRSYHCRSCDRCILRRDHHCIFSACCVGYKNHKFYMSLLFQVALGSLYASLLHLPYVWANMGGLNPMTFFSHCLPIPFLVFGLIDSWTSLCNFFSMLCIFGFLFSGGLFVYHMNLLVRNQTTHERHKSDTKYNLKNWQLNLTDCLGQGWPLTVFVSPIIDSKLSGDGIHFSTMKEHRYTR